MVIKMKIGFIGLGNMANAMIGGILAKGLYTKDELIGSSKTEATAERIHEKYGIKTCTDNAAILCKKSWIFNFTVVKFHFVPYPQLCFEVL